MVALAAVRQAQYIIVTVFQSTRDMGEKAADCPILLFGGDWRRRGIRAISLAELPSAQNAGFPVILAIQAGTNLLAPPMGFTVFGVPLFVLFVHLT
jgi:hypothetical protein